MTDCLINHRQDLRPPIAQRACCVWRPGWHETLKVRKTLRVKSCKTDLFWAKVHPTSPANKWEKKKKKKSVVDSEKGGRKEPTVEIRHNDAEFILLVTAQQLDSARRGCEQLRTAVSADVMERREVSGKKGRRVSLKCWCFAYYLQSLRWNMI